MSQYRDIRDAVWACRTIGTAAKMVALRLVEHWPRIYPSVASLSEFTGLSARSVARALRELEEQHVIRTRHHMGRSSTYEFVGVSIPEFGTPANAAGVAPPTPANASGDPCQICTPTPATVADEADNTKRTREAGGRKRRSPPVETPLPADWTPSKHHREYAHNLGLDLDTEVFSFKGWAEGRTAVSWNGTFSTRLANSVKWRNERGVKAPEPRYVEKDEYA